MSAGLAGRTVVVTGAAGGIGRAIALGAHGEGAVVVAADIDAARLDALEADRLLTRTTDVARRDEVEALVAFAVERTGRLDVLVNNAGTPGRGSVTSMPPGRFEETMAVHVFSAVHAMHAAVPHMASSGYGRIVNLLSRGAEVADPEGMPYAAAKAALFAVTRSAARGVPATDILVNGMIPGPTRTGIWGVDRPDLQAPEATWPAARHLMTLPAGGPTGRVFWDGEEYRLFHPDRNGGRGSPT